MARFVSFLVLFLVWGFGALGKGVHGENVNIPTTTQPLEAKWEEMEKNLKNVIGQGIKMILPSMMGGMGRTNISSSCVRDTMRLITGARSTKPWAMKIVGANLGIATGIFFETVVPLGAYDQCIDTEVINEHRKDEREVLFRGKYCAITVRPPLPPMESLGPAQYAQPGLKNFSMRNTVLGELAKHSQPFYVFPYRIGLCVPSGCSENDMRYLVDAASESTPLIMQVKWCEVKEENKFTPLVIAVLAISSFLALTIVAGTLADQYFSSDPKCNGLLLNILLSFSIKRNFKILFSTSTSSGELSCLYGVRCLSICWIILGHTVFYYHFETTREGSFFFESFQTLWYVFLYRGTLAVGTFFCLSGLLSCYIHMKLKKDLSRPSDFFIYVSHRIFRLFPSLVFVTIFAFLFDLIGSGPLWEETLKLDIHGCYDNWWTNFLFINNLYNVNNSLCIGHTWYIACDTQLYIFSIVVIHLLMKRPKTGAIVSLGIILISMVIAATVTVMNDFPPGIIFSSMSFDAWANFLRMVYVKPYVNAASYYVGILSGYMLICKPNLKLSKTVQVLGWCTFTVFTASVYFATRKWNLGVTPTLAENFFFSGCSRVTWALAVTWMIVCCATGHGGIINTILSWKIWYPLGRLSYAAYLLHYFVITAFQGTIRTETSHYLAPLMWKFFGHALVTHGAAMILFLSVEAPFASLEKVFHSTGKKANLPVKDNGGVNLEPLEKCPDSETTNFPPDVCPEPGVKDNLGFVKQ